MADEEEIQVEEEAEVDYHDASNVVSHSDDDDSDEAKREGLKKRRKVLRGKITRAINRLTEEMTKKLLVKRLAKKSLQDLRKDFDEAMSVNSELYDYETRPADHTKLDTWESNLVKDIHMIEIDIEDYIAEMSVKMPKKSVSPKKKEIKKTPVKCSIEESDSEEEVENERTVSITEPTESIDDWIDQLTEFQETVLPAPSGDMSIADALYRIEASRDIPAVKLTSFDGNPLHYVEFIESFRIHIHNKANLSDDLRMVQLKMALTGDAETAVRGLGSTGTMYATALKTIKDMYGHRSVIARAHINKVTRGSAKITDRHSLRTFSMDLLNCLSTLRRINHLADVNSTETLRQIVRRLPESLISSWKSTVADMRDKRQMPDLASVCEFVRKNVRAEFDPDFGDIHRDKPRDQRSEKRVHSAQKSDVKCYICQMNHVVQECPTFLDSTVSQRIDLIREHRLCFSCLNKGHVTRDCRMKKPCGQNDCKRTHHKLIHVNPQRVSGASVLDQESIMPVVRVKFRAPNGRVKEGNVLIDGGAGTTIIRRDFAHMLGLQGKRETIEISVVGGKQHISTESRRVKFWISARETGEEFSIEAHELEKTVPSVPPLDRSWLSSFNHLRDITFPHKAGSIDLILGVQYSHLHAVQETREGLPFEPVGKKTRLGWCVIGAESKVVRSHSVGFCQRIDHPDLERMYEMETIGVRAPDCKCPKEVMSRDDRFALRMLEESCKKTGDRYTIGLPWKRNKEDLPNNYLYAEKRLVSIEKSLLANPAKAKLYQQAMRDYVDNGWAELVKDPSEGTTVYYLPHHGVYRIDKPSTPLRVVFDPASTFEGVSLNSFLYRGPSLLGDLLGILLRFREKPVAFQGDVSKMFLQICLTESDTDVHRYLWRDMNVSQPPSVYRLKRVTFGDKSSPDMANYVMLKMAKEHHDTHPDAAEVLEKDRYVDDIIHSTDAGEDGDNLMKDIDTILATGSFKIKKWYSNSLTLHENEMRDLTSIPNHESPEDRLKTLGVVWNCKSDSICFKVDIKCDKKLTKRIVLSKLSQIFDPLGLATVTTIRCRIAMQNLWKIKGLQWDDNLPQEQCSMWFELFQDLANLNDVQFDRCLKPHDKTGSSELHIFCDGSMSAYGACAYLLWPRSRESSVKLVAAKARVAPLKQTTVPRLELMGALLASRLARTIYTELREKPDVYLWTDSQIVLRWLHSDSTSKKAFVGVRIAEIQTEWDVARWKFVPTQLNPADSLSRGIPVCQIGEFWTHGPLFLRKEKTEWPDQSVWERTGTQGNQEEKKPTKQVYTAVQLNPGQKCFIDYEKYSSWQKLLNVTAYCLRFINNLRSKPQERQLNESLLPEERQKAKEVLLKEAQKSLTDWGTRYSELSPFLGEDGLVKVGGRMKYSTLSYDEIHPTLLPASSHISKLILRSIHYSLSHAGAERTLSQSRKKYWIVHGRNAAKEIVKKCTICRKLRQPTHSTLMSDLPPERLRLFSPPYTTTGIDMFGPFYLRYGRNKKTKAWGVLFTCASVRAVHLEIVENLSTAAFLHALRRFVSHHGWPSVIISDNGTAFVGAERELRTLFQEGRRELQEFSTLHNLKWKFTTPLSPHQGGIYESMIKQAKQAIRVAIGDQVLSWNEMSTVFCEIESLLNSRPLGYHSNDPNDPQPLTPNHFLLGRASTEVPQGPFCESKSLCKRLEFIQVLITSFWKRFIKEYLPTLMRRSKWKTKNRQMRVGDIVIVADYQCARGKWPLARVTEVYPGEDGIVRNVKLRTQFGEYKRSVQRCCMILEQEADCSVE